MSAILVSQAMNTTLSLSVEVCSTFVIDTLIIWDTCWDNASVYVAGRPTWGCQVCHNCLGVYYDTDPVRGWASDQP